MFEMAQDEAQKLLRLNTANMMMSYGVMMQKMDKVNPQNLNLRTITPIILDFWSSNLKTHSPTMVKLCRSLLLGSFKTKKNIIKAVMAETEYGYSEEGIKENLENMMYQGSALKDQRVTQ